MKKILLSVIFSLGLTFCFAQSNEQIEIIPKKFFTKEAYKRCGIKMTPNQLIDLFKEDPQMQQYVKPLAVNYLFETIFKSAAGVLILWPLTQPDEDRNWNLAYIGLGCAVLTIPFDKAFSKKAKEAIGYYNNGYKTARVNFDLNIGANGVGVTMKF